MIDRHATPTGLRSRSLTTTESGKHSCFTHTASAAMPSISLVLGVLSRVQAPAELEGLIWGEIDEQRGRWSVSAEVPKTNDSRWVNVPPVIFDAVCALVPRDDRSPDRKFLQGFGGGRRVAMIDLRGVNATMSRLGGVLRS